MSVRVMGKNKVIGTLNIQQLQKSFLSALVTPKGKE